MMPKMIIPTRKKKPTFFSSETAISSMPPYNTTSGNGWNPPTMAYQPFVRSHEKPGQKIIRGQDQHERKDYRPGGGTADSPGATGSLEPDIARHEGDDAAEHGRLD